MKFQTPDWVKRAVFYQIFPDRFAKGRINHAPRGISLKPWGSPANEQGYQGGDLYGVAEKLDYLRELGINALYLNPIFSSASNHRYHTFDYYQVDPLLGGNEALRHLLNEAHAREMRVVLDGVFNHASRGFWAFHHILENGSESPYLDWFHIEDLPLNPYPKGEGETLNYKAWWDLPALPKFNTDNPGVRDYLFGVAEYWIDFGIDGWRLDVPEEIDDDSFWREFRQRVKARNAQAYICGEIWEKAGRWLQGDQFDGVMNYPLGMSALSFFGARSLRTDYQQNHLDLTPCDAKGFCRRVTEVYSWYDWEINRAQLNLLDSHDMPRAKWLVNENSDAVKQALAFILLAPGAPCIYYGTEIGMTGATDPYCREAFPWDSPDQWDNSTADVIKRFATLRHRFPVITEGEYQMTPLDENVVSIVHQSDSQMMLSLFNRSDQSLRVALPEGLLRLRKLDSQLKISDQILNKEVVLPKLAIEVYVG